MALRHLEEDAEAWKSGPLLNEITYSASNHEAVINKQPAGIHCSVTTQLIRTPFASSKAQKFAGSDGFSAFSQ